MVAGTRASASVGACGFEPDLHHSNHSQIAEYRASLGSMGITSEGRACDYYALGTLYHFDGDYEKAIENYDKAIGWWKTYSDAYEARGDAYAALGKPELAAESYRKAAATTQDTPGELNDRCWTRAIRGAPLDRALADCTKVLKDYPDASSVLQSRCFVYYRMGRFDDAIADCTHALVRRPKKPSALYIRGLAELGKGDEEAGKADVAAAVNSYDRIEKIYALYGIEAP